MQRTSDWEKRLLLLCFMLFTIFVTALSAHSQTQKKPAEAVAPKSAAAPEQTRKKTPATKSEHRLIDINPAARVNGVAISRADLDKGLNNHISQKGMTSQMIINPERYKAVQQEVLDMLITRELLWQETRKKNFLATEQEVEQALEREKSRFPSEVDFKLHLRQNDYKKAEYAEILRQRLSIAKFVHKEIAEGITVSEGEIHGYYQKHPEQFEAPEQIRARHILVKVQRGADETARQEAKKKIERILQKARDGADFAELARTHSQDSSGSNGGDLGFFTRGKMQKPFEKAAFALEAEEISNVVETRFGYHIIKIEEKIKPHTMAQEVVQAQLHRFLYAGKVRDAVHKRVKSLREASNIEIFLR